LTTLLDNWKANIPDELEFWRFYPEHYPESFRARAAGPGLPAPLRNAIFQTSTEPSKSPTTGLVSFRLLEIGSGPLSGIDATAAGFPLDITYTDPLAGHFDELYEAWGYRPPYTVHAIPGEDVDVLYHRDTFDLVYSHNAIDHAYDVPRVAEAIGHVLKPGGVAVVEVIDYCGRRNRYKGLHQWDLYVEAGKVHASAHGDPDYARAVLFPGADITADFWAGETWLRIVWKKPHHSQKPHAKT